MTTIKQLQRVVATRRPLLLASGFMALLLAVGCDSGPDSGTVSGTVTVDGAVPMAGSSISFIPANGNAPSSGATLENGKYSVKVPVGAMKVAIYAPRPVAKQKTPAREGPSAGEIVDESLGEEYNVKTTLTLDVKSGSQVKDWDLKSMGKK